MAVTDNPPAVDEEGFRRAVHACQGKIVARASTANASDIAAENSAWHQWSLDAILQRFADCCRSL
ncbi:hypothetical protein ONO12_26245, partial [Salmonella enterica subsp. enterica serovar Montevideo]|nr:hypothetical protein [Salmonella enterica subsp. enterica serovar Montevideo]